MAIVTLITDFGTRDGYAGEMKGALLDRCPTADLVDITHDIEPGDVRGAAWVLSRVWERFPTGTVHLVVVDPGVGGNRRTVAVEQGGRWFVGPDNGLISLAIPGLPSGARLIDSDSLGLAPASVTFHGRDLFSPIAARLALGNLDGLEPIDLQHVRYTDFPDDLFEIVYVDGFGNLMTGVRAELLGGMAGLCVCGRNLDRQATFNVVTVGSLFCYENAVGLIEIAANQAKNNRRYQFVYAIALNTLKQTEKALTVLEKTHQQFPDDSEILITLITINRDAGNKQSALAYAYKLMDIMPANPDLKNLINQLKGHK